jgi:hypothetical protein
MRELLGKRLIKAMEEILAATEEENNRLKKVKEGMQEAGNDKYVDDKRLQKKTLPSGIRNGKEPADVPLEIDELSYSKKDKKTKALPQNVLLKPIQDANTAEVKMAKPKENKDKKYDINRVEQIHSAWQENKAKQEKYDINRIEKIKTTRADEDGDEGIKMALTNLKSMANLTTTLIAHLEQGNAECLSEAWVQSKLTLAEDYVSVIHSYIMYKNEDDTLKDEAFFGNFDGHDGHSKLKKDQSDYERGNF